MPSRNTDRVKSIFVEALEQPSVDRPAFLDHACAGDDELVSVQLLSQISL